MEQVPKTSFDRSGTLGRAVELGINQSLSRFLSEGVKLKFSGACRKLSGAGETAKEQNLIFWGQQKKKIKHEYVCLCVCAYTHTNTHVDSYMCHKPQKKIQVANIKYLKSYPTSLAIKKMAI